MSDTLLQILRAIKSRCGSRLRRGDFALSSDALVLAVRDNTNINRSSANAGVTAAERDQQQSKVGSDGGVSSGVGGDDAGEIVAIVELCLRQPDGWFPFNWLFLVRKGMILYCLLFRRPKAMVNPSQFAPTRGRAYSCILGPSSLRLVSRETCG